MGSIWGLVGWLRVGYVTCTVTVISHSYYSCPYVGVAGGGFFCAARSAVSFAATVATRSPGDAHLLHATFAAVCAARARCSFNNVNRRPLLRVRLLCVLQQRRMPCAFFIAEQCTLLACGGAATPQRIQRLSQRLPCALCCGMTALFGRFSLLYGGGRDGGTGVLRI